MGRRCHRVGLVAAALVVVASILMPTLAWARYSLTGSAGSETNTFSTHVMATPPEPTCPGLAVLSVTLSWSVSDASKVTAYYLGESGSISGTYSYTNEGLLTSKTLSISLGDQYFKVYTVHDLWTGTPSPAVTVDGLLIAATCS